MPVLKKIIIQDFRNIELQELSFSPNVNCIWGGNGEGKTNLLDAVYYLSMTKSGIQGSDRFNFRHGCDSFAISGDYSMQNGTSSRFSISVQSGGEKKLRRDDKPCTRISDHIGLLPIVMVSPDDISLVSESGDGRRRFANGVISQMDRKYLSDVQTYLKLLAQRNRLLKESNPEDALLDAFDLAMEPCAQAVFERRREFCERLAPLAGKFYRDISGGRESISIKYRSELEGAPLRELLREGRGRDKALHFTSSGIQRDDFIFEMDGFPIRKCGSQGQQKSFLVALKFAQYEMMKASYGFPPVLLLDDLFDKLDLDRVGNLLQMVAGSDFGQIFLSDTNKTRTGALIDGLTADRAYFKASGGCFTAI